MSDETERDTAVEIADRWAKEHLSTMCFVGGRLEIHLTEGQFVGLVRDVLALRSAGDGAADVVGKVIAEQIANYEKRVDGEHSSTARTILQIRIDTLKTLVDELAVAGFRAQVPTEDKETR